jgi:NTP pyrophosphatase (non-canonical NTP hydrolase)
MTEETARKIRAERQRQTEKWGGEHFVTMAPERVLAVLTEEVGEVARAILEIKRRPEGRAELEAEIVQVAAVAVRWLDECFSSKEKP